MSGQYDPRAGLAVPIKRRHDGCGISQEAHRVINDHGLGTSKVPDLADLYALKEGTDFNLAPARDFEGAPLGRLLARAVITAPAFAPSAGKFDDAPSAFGCATSDCIVSK